MLCTDIEKLKLKKVQKFRLKVEINIVFNFATAFQHFHKIAHVDYITLHTTSPSSSSLSMSLLEGDLGRSSLFVSFES
jgi:hypothetical protein